MRTRDRILSSLESAYHEAFEGAKKSDDREEMARLDFQFQRDQIGLEVLLDMRDLLEKRSPPATAQDPGEPTSLLEEGSSLIQKAQALRRITKLC